MAPVERPSAEPAPKRRRIALACTSCRSRKSKCDGVQPMCTSCTQFNFACVYDIASTGATPLMVRNEDYIALQDRVSSLEESLLLLQCRLSQATGLLDRTRLAPFERLPLMEPRGQASRSGLIQGGPARSFVPSSSHNETGVDAMGISYKAGPAPAHFGLSSAASLIDLLLQTIPADGQLNDISAPPEMPFASSPGGGPSGGSDGMTSSVQGAASSVLVHELESFVLPSLSRAEGLLQIFVNDIWPLYPIVCRTIVTSDMRRLLAVPLETRASDATLKPPLGLLHAIFALTAAFTGADEEGATIFRRARSLIGTDELSGTPDTLCQVQSLIYLVLYLQSTDSPSSAWHSIGRAIRVATALGLHTSRPKITPWNEESEGLASRAWYGCVNIDRFMSMSLGRPSNFYEVWGEPRAPRPLRDEAPDQLDYFVNCTNLFKIMGRILISFQAGPASSASSSALRSALGEELQAWNTNLPSWLRLSSYVGDARPPADAVMLTLRFYAVRMLLYRPLVQQALHVVPLTAAAGALSNEPGFLAGFASCVSDAAETVRILLQAGTQSGFAYNKAGAGWYRLYFTFNAFTVLASSLISRVDETQPGGGDGDPITIRRTRLTRLMRCEQCVTIISNLSRLSASAARCLGIAQTLLKGISGLSLNGAVVAGSTSESLDDVPSVLDIGDHSDMWGWLHSQPDLFAHGGGALGLDAPLPDSLWDVQAPTGCDPWELLGL